MKKFFNNNYIKTFLVILINILLVDIIFKLLNSSSILDVSMIRILFSSCVISSVFAMIINNLKTKPRKIVTSIFNFIVCAYACAQAGFYNFLGVYMSLQTSSQLGAVVDYIKDFFLSFKISFFLVFIPFILTVLYFIFLDKEENKYSIKKQLINTFSIILLFGALFFSTIKLNVFQNNLQTTSNMNLFLTASNPSLTIEQFGTTGFGILDFRAMIHPIAVIEDYKPTHEEREINDNSRIIDDTLFNSVIENEEDETYKAISNYFINQSITDKNDYTGLFKDKNLIVIMMESANDILINKDYYPNFYKMYSEGWSWDNNYSPRNSCATMNNEFSGMTSLYSIYNTCTASKYKNNTYFESIFNLFNKKNYVTFSSHDYTEAYYPRSTIHKNMGSKEYYGVQKLGIKYSNEYINWANDDEFMEAILKIIDKKTANNEHFMTWLTTVSSHQPYSSSSIQGDKYYSMTDKTGYSSDVRRFMSKLKILDNGLGILLEGLKSRGILDDTVIILYGDHYPYGINKDHLNQVLEYDANEDMNAEQVPFVIYNSTIEAKKFDQYTFYLNILPTVANLFDLDYDPRYYLGTDLFSKDALSLTVFADGSWKNEIAYYNAKKNKIKYYTDITYTTEELNAINQNITTKVNISSKVIKENYFEHLNKKLEDEKLKLNELSNIMCLNSDKDKYNE